jgi:iron complex transport system permease protein
MAPEKSCQEYDVAEAIPFIAYDQENQSLPRPLVAPRSTAAFAILLVLLVSAALAALAVGSVRLAVTEVAAAVCGGSDPFTRTIVLDLRLPRVLLAILIGVALGTSGAAYQALFRNPLADPFVVGASSGAATGAALVIVTGWAGAAASVGPVSLGAFAGALLAVCLVYAIAATGRMPPVALLLIGTVVSTMLFAAVWLLMALADEHLHHIVGWLMGGLAGHGWDTVQAAWPLILAGTTVLCLLGRPLDALCSGEDVARSLGLWVGAATALVLAAASLTVATAVAAGGVIGFVGLAAPHLARPLVGVAHARLVPASGLVGALLLLAADALARCLAPPLELPIGVVTALLGGPFFLIVLRRTWSARWQGS